MTSLLLLTAALAHAQVGFPIGATEQGYLIEGAGIVHRAAPAIPENSAPQPAPEDRNSFIPYIGGPETQAGDEDAGDEPVERLPEPKSPFRSQFSIEKPKAPEASPILEQARAFMAQPPYNPNNGTRDWNGWCLGFVNATLKAVRGKRDPQMSQIAAKYAYNTMAAAGRISKDLRAVPAGAAFFWTGCSQWGHAAIATGEMSADGTPIMITTSKKGIREMSTKQFGCGLPAGWGKI